MWPWDGRHSISGVTTSLASNGCEDRCRGNEVWSVRVNGHLAVGRLGKRSDADLSWETELLRHLDREGMTVPVPIPTTDGRHFADGLVVMALF